MIIISSLFPGISNIAGYEHDTMIHMLMALTGPTAPIFSIAYGSVPKI